MRAASRCDLCCLSKTAFEQLLDLYPESRAPITEAATRRMNRDKQMNQKLVDAGGEILRKNAFGEIRSHDGRSSGCELEAALPSSSPVVRIGASAAGVSNSECELEEDRRSETVEEETARREELEKLKASRLSKRRGSTGCGVTGAAAAAAAAVTAAASGLPGMCGTKNNRSSSLTSSDACLLPGSPDTSPSPEATRAGPTVQVDEMNQEMNSARKDAIATGMRHLMHAHDATLAEMLSALTLIAGEAGNRG